MLKVFEILSLLTPYDIEVPKVRYGTERDGGYVLAQLPSTADVLSFGVGPDVTFEHQMACEGRRVFLHDHTVEATPQQHENFRFSRKGICGEGMTSVELASLSEHIAVVGDFSKDAILKMDVEGFEWQVFATAERRTLANFNQIVIEVHWLEQLIKEPHVEQSLKNLNEDFALFHVHSNNCTNIYIVDGFAVPSVLELSYVRKSLVSLSPSQTIYPTPLDKGNRSDVPDHPLFFYPFLPSVVSAEAIASVARRIEGRL